MFVKYMSFLLLDHYFWWVFIDDLSGILVSCGMCTQLRAQPLWFLVRVNVFFFPTPLFLSGFFFCSAKELINHKKKKKCEQKGSRVDIRRFSRVEFFARSLLTYVLLRNRTPLYLLVYIGERQGNISGEFTQLREP